MISARLATTSAGTYALIRPSAPESARRQGVVVAEQTDGTDKADQALIQQLRARDGAVRRHEAAHSAAGGRYTGAITYSFKRGPDGVNYAVGGEVSIDVSKVPGDPAATIEKAQSIRAAALAPADPSSQDRLIAAEASRMEASARRELQQQRRDDRVAPKTGYDAILADDRKAQSALRLINYTV